MVSKTTLADYDFADMEAYYSYIMESEVNGQIVQMENLIGEMSAKQKKDFLDWWENQEVWQDFEKARKYCLDIL